jgi:hypothetical protein
VEKWRPRVDAVTNARYRNMLNVILGESIEHQRLFQQASAGLEDLLGRRTGGVPRVGGSAPDEMAGVGRGASGSSKNFEPYRSL